MVAHVTWKTPADAPNAASGSIHIEFPKIPGLEGSIPDLRNGGSPKTGTGQWVFREITVYRSAASLALGRLAIALAAGLPFPSRITEWNGWDMTLLIVGFVGCILAGISVSQGFMSSIIRRVIIISQLGGLLVGLIVVWAATQAAVVTVQIDAETLSYPRGRGDPKWVTAVTARWVDLRSAKIKSKTYRSTRTEWLEVEFPDGKKRIIRDAKAREAVLGFYVRFRLNA
jgi:hypothetical protein